MIRINQQELFKKYEVASLYSQDSPTCLFRMILAVEYSELLSTVRFCSSKVMG